MNRPPPSRMAALTLATLASASGESVPRPGPQTPQVLSGPALVASDPAVLRQLEERHAAGLPIVVSGFPMPSPEPGSAPLSVDLALRPIDAFEPGARARIVLADGSERFLAPRVRGFAGALPGGSAFLASTSAGLQGYVTRGARTWAVGPDPGTRETRLALLEAAPFGRAGCGVFEEPLSVGLLPESPAAGSWRALQAEPILSSARVFIEVDDALRQRFATNQECVDYCALVVTATSEIYRRDLGLRLVVPDGFLRVWNRTPPWGAITALNQLDRLYGWWMSPENPQRDLDRAAVHLFTSPVIGGTARGSVSACDDRRAYEISSLNGRLLSPPQHTAGENWDLFVVAHEFGHTFGSPHTSAYSPPIECQDGSGPDSGTLMSYCHQEFGVAGIGMRFHPRVQQRMRAVLELRTCLERTLLQRGDYDGNGRLDPGDLQAAEALLLQGFRSLGAEEVLDMDADGDFDPLDRELLAAALASLDPGTGMRVRNGTGINRTCYRGLSAPFLGESWRAEVEAAGLGRETWLVACMQPLYGFLTPRGELLVRTPSEGGVKLFHHVAFSDGVRALYQLPLPADPSLAGRRIATQALVLEGPGGAHFCNAIDLTLSTR